MTWKRIIACTIVVGAMATAVVLADIDARTEEHYGLRTIREPYQGRIRQIIGLSMIQYKAVTSSGFKVYTLEDVIVQPGTIQKFFIWKDLDGNKLVTVHLLGLDHIYMKKGDAYVGRADIVWLTAYRDGREVKFTIQR